MEFVTVYQVLDGELCSFECPLDAVEHWAAAGWSADKPAESRKSRATDKES